MLTVYRGIDHSLMDSQLKSIHQHLHGNPTAFFLIKSDGAKAEVGALDKYEEFFANVPPSSVRGFRVDRNCYLSLFSKLSGSTTLQVHRRILDGHSETFWRI